MTHSSCSLTGQSELTPRIYYARVTESAGDVVSTLDLKSMGGVNESLKQRVAVAPQNGDLSLEKKLLKKYDTNMTV